MPIAKEDLSVGQQEAVLRAIHDVHEAQRTTAKRVGGSALRIEADVARAVAAQRSQAQKANNATTVEYLNTVDSWHQALAPFDAPKPPPPPAPTVIGPLDTGSISFDGGVPVGGWSRLTLWPDGSYQFDGHFHDSGFPSYNDAFVWVVMDNLTKTAFVFPHFGHMAGTLESGSRDDNWSNSGRNAELSQNWSNFAFGYTWHWEAAVNWDLNAVLGDVMSAIGTVLSVVQVL